MCMTHATPARAYDLTVNGIQPGRRHTSNSNKGWHEDILIREVTDGLYDNPSVYHPAFAALIKLAATNMPEAQAFTVCEYPKTAYYKWYPACDVIESIAHAFGCGVPVYDANDPETRIVWTWNAAGQEAYFLSRDTHDHLAIADWMTRLPAERRPPEVVQLFTAWKPDWLKISQQRHTIARGNTSTHTMWANNHLATTQERAHRQTLKVSAIRGKDQRKRIASAIAGGDPRWERILYALASGYTPLEIKTMPSLTGTEPPPTRSWQYSQTVWLSQREELQATLPPSCKALLRRLSPGKRLNNAKRLAKDCLSLAASNNRDFAAFFGITESPAPALAAAA